MLGSSQASRPKTTAQATEGGAIASSVIGADLVVVGSVEGPGTIVVAGAVAGDVRGRHVTVGPGGRIAGSLEAASVRVDGTVEGPITAEAVVVGGAGRVVGIITHNAITIEPGAQVDGRRPWRPAGFLASKRP
jgi:cytoskeletal protein CcmA (bactofilin family)